MGEALGIQETLVDRAARSQALTTLEDGSFRCSVLSFAPNMQYTCDMAATTIEPSPNTDGEQPAGDGNPEVIAPPAVKRIFFRAFVRTGGQVGASRERDRVEWHLSACTSPHTELGHCTEGLHMIETIGHPDGHCIVDGVCGLCGAPDPAAG